MRAGIEISSVWEDVDLFEVSVRASNGKFRGEATCYTTRLEIEKLSESIAGFPKSTRDDVRFSTFLNNDNSYFTLQFICVDSSGHVAVLVKVADLRCYSNARPDRNVAEFELEIEPAAIDRFSAELARLSSANIGDVTAVLDGKA